MLVKKKIKDLTLEEMEKICLSPNSNCANCSLCISENSVCYFQYVKNAEKIKSYLEREVEVDE